MTGRILMGNYTTVTELPGQEASSEQLARLYHRYKFASQFCEGKDVFEVACGAGIALGYLARKARRVVGGDIDENNLKFAQEHYKGRHNIQLFLIDAHKLPFTDNSFDVMILFEAIYYLLHPERFIREAQRVLRKGGNLLICTVNKDWSGFNPSPYSYEYFSIYELFGLLKQENFNNIAVYGGCPVTVETLKDRTISLIRRVAVALNIIPKTMKGKELLKRIFFGKLLPLPPEISGGMAEYIPPVIIPYDSPNFGYKVLYVVGYK